MGCLLWKRRNPGLKLGERKRFEPSRYIRLKKDSPAERVVNGIYFENPTFVLVLGMCPTLATTTSVTNAVGMGLSTTAILTLSNLFISLLGGIIPERMRMPSYIVIIASFVTVIDFLMEGFTPQMYQSLGVYIPLIVVNCIIMGRAEAYAGKNKPVPALFDGLGMGLGFTLGLIFIASIRELVGAGTWAGIRIMPASYEPVSIFVLSPGAFLVLAMLVAVMNRLRLGAARRTDNWDPTGRFVCSDCRNCTRVLNCSGKPAADLFAPHSVYDMAGPRNITEPSLEEERALEEHCAERGGADHTEHAKDQRGGGLT